MCGEFFLESHDTVDAVFTGFNTLTCIKLREKIFFFLALKYWQKYQLTAASLQNSQYWLCQNISVEPKCQCV